MVFELEGIRAKLARSREHAQAIKNEVQAWIDRKPYSLSNQVNADSTRYSLILRENEPAPFQHWTLMFADAINNLRTALDYLVYAIAVSESTANPPPCAGSLTFPITVNRAEFDNAVSRDRLGKISGPVRDIFESVQPYRRPHPTLPPLLSILQKLNNADKHRMLRLAYGAISHGNLGFIGDFPQDGRQFVPAPNIGQVKDGDEVFAMVIDRPTPNMQWDQTIVEIQVAVWHDKRDPSGPEFTGHTEFLSLLNALADEVRTIVFMFAKIP